MMTVHQVSELTGVTVRALQYYDRLGLLPPAALSGAGYRLYDEAALERLQQILLFRELEFPLKEIKRILNSPNYDRNKALEQQIELLTIKREHIDRLIRMAQTVKLTGGVPMNFEAFDKKKLEQYAARARASWGATPEYREYEEKNGQRSPAELKESGDRLMGLLAAFGAMKQGSPASAEAQEQVRRVQDFITEHYYHCSDGILAQLGKMYAAGGEFTENIDAVGGPGTAEFANRAIEAYCRR
ncbi:MAG: MerR family transcriptional regulator [Oscillospiraceae bacterium]|nr:MerR family transcriptional regulator [Oscillospiraceae bacterium]